MCVSWIQNWLKWQRNGLDLKEMALEEEVEEHCVSISKMVSHLSKEELQGLRKHIREVFIRHPLYMMWDCFTILSNSSVCNCMVLCMCVIAWSYACVWSLSSINPTTTLYTTYHIPAPAPQAVEASHTPRGFSKNQFLGFFIQTG